MKSSHGFLGWFFTAAAYSESMVLMDRHFFAFDLLWEIWQKQKCDFIVRIRRGTNPKLLYRIERGDSIVEVAVPRHYRRRRPDMPRTWRLRLVTYRPPGARETIRLLATRTDHDSIKSAELATLYHDRWDVETCIDEIKTHLCDCSTVKRAVVFRSKTPERVGQEFYGMLLAYNSIRNVMADVAKEKSGEALRLSFTAALERIRKCLCDIVLCRSKPEERVRAMLESIGCAQVPKRPDRHFPRAVKNCRAQFFVVTKSLLSDQFKNQPKKTKNVSGFLEEAQIIECSFW